MENGKKECCIGCWVTFFFILTLGMMYLKAYIKTIEDIQFNWWWDPLCATIFIFQVILGILFAGGLGVLCEELCRRDEDEN